MELYMRCYKASDDPDNWDVRGLLFEAGADLSLMGNTLKEHRKVIGEALSGLYAIQAILHDTTNPTSIIATDLIERVNGLHRSLKALVAAEGGNGN